MTIQSVSTNETIFRELGTRVQQFRIGEGLSQQQLAERAGVTRKTLTNLEGGAPVSFETYLNVLRALGLLGNLNILVPEHQEKPTDVLAELTPNKKRASRKRNRERSETTANTWKWGDEV